jgi:hypothetical protein
VNESRSVDTPSLWLPLLRTLTLSSPHWGVWKNADRALAGIGDIDSAAPGEEWKLLSERHEHWAASNQAIAAIACSHVPDLLILIAVFPRLEKMLQLDLFAHCSWRGSRLFSAEQLTPLMVEDPRGFRRLTPGAEGVLLLLLNGVRWGGRPDVGALGEKRVWDLLQEDPAGVAAAADVVGAPGEVMRAVTAYREGDWARLALLSLETRAVIRSLIRRRALARRVVFRSGLHARICPVDQALRNDRRVPANLGKWFQSIRSMGPTHRLVQF